MVDLPDLQAQPPAAEVHSRYLGERPAGLLPDLLLRCDPGYRRRPERQAPEPMTPRRGRCWVRRFCFYPEVIARGNKAAETVFIPGLLSAGARRVLRRAPAEAQGTEPGGAGLALDVPDTGLDDAAQ